MAANCDRRPFLLLSVQLARAGLHSRPTCHRPCAQMAPESHHRPPCLSVCSVPPTSPPSSCSSRSGSRHRPLNRLFPLSIPPLPHSVRFASPLNSTPFRLVAIITISSSNPVAWLNLSPHSPPWPLSSAARPSAPAAPVFAAVRARPNVSMRMAARLARIAQRACTSAIYPPRALPTITASRQHASPGPVRAFLTANAVLRLSRAIASLLPRPPPASSSPNAQCRQLPAVKSKLPLSSWSDPAASPCCGDRLRKLRRLSAAAAAPSPLTRSQHAIPCLLPASLACPHQTSDTFLPFSVSFFGCVCWQCEAE